MRHHNLLTHDDADMLAAVQGIVEMRLVEEPFAVSLWWLANLRGEARIIIVTVFERDMETFATSFLAEHHFDTILCGDSLSAVADGIVDLVKREHS